jgi:hypothetical protein
MSIEYINSILKEIKNEDEKTIDIGRRIYAV